MAISVGGQLALQGTAGVLSLLGPYGAIAGTLLSVIGQAIGTKRPNSRIPPTMPQIATAFLIDEDTLRAARRFLALVAGTPAEARIPTLTMFGFGPSHRELWERIEQEHRHGWDVSFWDRSNTGAPAFILQGNPAGAQAGQLSPMRVLLGEPGFTQLFIEDLFTRMADLRSSFLALQQSFPLNFPPTVRGRFTLDDYLFAQTLRPIPSDVPSLTVDAARDQGVSINHVASETRGAVLDQPASLYDWRSLGAGTAVGTPPPPPVVPAPTVPAAVTAPVTTGAGARDLLAALLSAPRIDAMRMLRALPQTAIGAQLARVVLSLRPDLTADAGGRRRTTSTTSAGGTTMPWVDTLAGIGKQIGTVLTDPTVVSGALNLAGQFVGGGNAPTAMPGGSPIFGSGFQWPQLPGGGSVVPTQGRSFLDLPMVDLVGQGAGAITEPFSASPAGARAQAHIKVNPSSGRLTWFKPAGRPVLFAGDMATCRTVNKLARRARRASGGR